MTEKCPPSWNGEESWTAWNEPTVILEFLGQIMVM